jgi:hypothetical protein
MTFVQSFSESDATPTAYVDYLRHTVAVAKRTLAQPEEQWPKGSSHVISRQVISEAQEAYEELALEHGLFDAHGRLASFASQHA